MTDRNYGAIRSADEFERFVDRLIAAGKPFGFDIESGYVGEDKEGVALLPFHPDWILVGFSFTNSTNWARYVPVAHDDGNNVDDPVRTAKALWRLLQTGLGVAHNLSFEVKGISRWFRDVLSSDPEIGAQVVAARGMYPYRSDTMLEAYLSAAYHPQQVGKGLKGLTKHIFSHEMTNFMDLFPFEDTDMGPALKRGKTKYVRFNTRFSTSARVIEYACEDSVWCLALHEKHYEEQKDTFIFKVEMQLLPVLVEMEMEGLALDWATISRKAAEADRFRNLMNEEIQQVLSERLGRPININLGSVPQLSAVLYEPAPEGLGLPIKERSEKTNNPSTSESALRAIAKADPIIKRILEWREVNKLYGSYLHKYETELAYSPNGRAYPNHNQAGALTGRMSVDGVSYQQWPKPYHYELRNGDTFDLNFRDLLIAPEGYRIVGYDFSQVELRVLAGMANERALLAAFADGTDIHKATASSMMGIPLAEVTKKQRSQGKTLNFAVVYGSGPQNIADMLTAPDAPVTKDDAVELLARYFAAFSGLKNWMDARVAEGREQGYVETKFGRKFTVWEYQDSRDFIRQKGDRMCVNAPVQGGAADYMKMGMVRVQKAIKKAGLADKIRLVMTVHDALEFYVHESVSTQDVIDLVNPQVSFKVAGLPEIRADWHEGYSWGSVAEINLGEDKKILSYGIEDHDETYPDFASVNAALQSLKAPKPAEPKVIEVAPEPEQPAEFVGTEREVAPWDLPQVAVVTMTGLPLASQWAEFQAFLALRPGIDSVLVEVRGAADIIEMSAKVKLVQTDQTEISQILGGASLSFRSTSPAVELEDIEL